MTKGLVIFAGLLTMASGVPAADPPVVTIDLGPRQGQGMPAREVFRTRAAAISTSPNRARTRWS